MQWLTKNKKKLIFQPGHDLKKYQGKKRLKLAFFIIVVFLLLFFLSQVKKIFNLSLSVNLKKEPKNIVKPINDSLLESKIKEELVRFNLKIKSLVIVNEEDSEIVLDNNIRVLLNNQENLKYQLTSLQLILDRFRIEGRLLKKIDLRFKNPVIE